MQCQAGAGPDQPHPQISSSRIFCRRSAMSWHMKWMLWMVSSVLISGSLAFFKWCKYAILEGGRGGLQRRESRRRAGAWQRGGGGRWRQQQRGTQSALAAPAPGWMAELVHTPSPLRRDTTNGDGRRGPSAHVWLRQV